MKYRPCFEELEQRTLLAADLQIGVTESFTFHDADGDQITLRISGSAGRVTLLEDLSVGVGNGDGKLDDGEVLGGIVIEGASINFVLRISAEAEGNGVVQLGQVTAISQIIAGIYTEGPATFHMTSFVGQGFLGGGGLTVDTVRDRLALANLAGNATVHIRGDLPGEMIIKDNLAGRLIVGGQWTGNLIVGENFTGRIIALQDAYGEVQIIGNFNGTATIAGSAAGRWLVVGSLNGRLEAGGDIERLDIIRSLTGQVEAGNQLWIDIGHAAGPSSSIDGREVFVYVKSNLWGEVYGSHYVYLKVNGSILNSARVRSDGPMNVVYGERIESGAVLFSLHRTIRYLPNYTQGTVITSVPYVITAPGLYRLSRDLLYHGAGGAAIEIRASNVTLDLQGYALVNTTGPTTFAVGIQGIELNNVTVRNGAIRGFYTGINLDGAWASRYVVEEIRAEGNWYYGIRVNGANSIVRNNVVLDTGGLAVPGYTIIVAMKAAGSKVVVENNIIAGIRRSIYNVEWVGLHLDQAFLSTVQNNIFAADRVRLADYAIWKNGRPWADSSRTTSMLAGNLFVNMFHGVVWADESRGTYTGNILLDVPYDFIYYATTGNRSRPLNAGNNFNLNTALSPVALRQLEELQRRYGFEFAGSLWVDGLPLTFHQNHLGFHERWFVDRDRHWYFVLPDGRLYRYGSGGLTAASLIAVVNPMVYRDPDLLFAARAALPAQTADLLVELRHDYFFRVVGGFQQNAFGRNEKWFQDRVGDWFSLTPDGRLYRWKGIARQLGDFVVQLDPLVWVSPSHLLAVPVTLSTAAREHLGQLRGEYGFLSTGSFHRNLYGLNEKWIKDRHGNWFALTPDGTLYRWNGEPGELGEQVTVVPVFVWDNPNLLLQAQVQPAEEFLDRLAQLRRDYGFRSAGHYYRNLYGMDEKWFRDRHGNWFALTSDGALYRWNDEPGELGEQIDLLEPLLWDNPTHLFNAQVVFSEVELDELAQLRRDHGFQLRGSFLFNLYNQNEKWFVDRMGHWFSITPDGQLYRWEGVNGELGELLYQLSPLVWDNPNHLWLVPAAFSEEEQLQLTQLRHEHGLRFGGHQISNIYHHHEIWFIDRHGEWFALTPDGTLHRWNGVAGELGKPMVQLSPLVWDNPNHLLQAPVELSDMQLQELSELREDYGFRFSTSFHTNWAGENEKWFVDRDNNWYALLPDGQLLLYTGGSLLSSVETAVLDPVVYDNPNLLLRAEINLEPRVQEQIARLKRIYGLTLYTSSVKPPSFGAGITFQDRHGRLYLLLKDGRLYQYDGINMATSPLIERLDPILFDFPEYIVS